MAGNDEGDGVGADRRAHGAGRRRLADILRHMRIGDGLAHRDLQQALPDAHLEVRAQQHDTQRLVAVPAGRIEDPLGIGCCRGAVFHIDGVRPAPRHILETFRLLTRIGKGAAGQPTIGDHHQRQTEWRRVKAIADLQSAALHLPLAGRHGLMRHEEIVKAAWAGHADFDGRLQKRQIFLAQKALGVIERHGLQKGLWRQSSPARKGLLQLGGGLVEPRGNLLQRRLVAVIHRQYLDHLAHRLVVGADGRDIFLQHDIGIHGMSPWRSEDHDLSSASTRFLPRPIRF